MLLDCRVTFYVSFGTQISMVEFVFWGCLDDRSRPCRIESKLKIQIFLQKIFILSMYSCLRIPISNLFSRTTIRNAENRVSKSEVTFSSFFFSTIEPPKIKIMFWNIVCVLFVCSFTAYTVVE